MKKKYPKPAGKIEYARLKKKTDLIKLCADFYLLYAMKTIGEDRSKNAEGFLRSREEFSKDLTKSFDEAADELGKLFLAYFPLAVLTELQNKDEIKASEKKIEKVSNGFLESIPENEDELLKYIEKEIPTCAKALEFFGTAKSVFGKLKWESGYGGKKWAQIAETARMRLSGEIDTTIFVDTAFNIEHHGGHIFDKHGNIRCDGRKLNAVLCVKRDSSIERMKKLTKKYASNYVESFFNAGNRLGWWQEEEKNGEK